MTLQTSTQIGEILRNAVVFNPQNWPGGDMNSDSLLQTVQRLFDLLAQRQIDYVLVGGVAMLYYVEGRNTQDLDILMAASALKKLPEFEVTAKERFFARASYEGLQIDILLSQNPFFKQVRTKHALVERFLDREIRLATVEGLVLLKLYALPSLYRQGNFTRVGLYENDIATLLYAYPLDPADLLKGLSPYVDGSDLAEIERILDELQGRIRRFRQNSG